MTRTTLLFCFIFLLGDSTAFAARLCQQEFRAIALEVLSEQSKNNYCRGFCFSNSGELARTLAKKLHTKINEKDLRILVVRHKNLPSVGLPFWEKEAMEEQHSIFGALARGGGKEWDFHAVTEYKGDILDLDYDGEPKIIPLRRYIKTMFPKNTHLDKKGRFLNDEEDLIITAIPAVDYFNEFKEKTHWSLKKDFQHFVNRYESMSYQAFSKTYKGKKSAP